MDSSGNQNTISMKTCTPKKLPTEPETIFAEWFKQNTHFPVPEKSFRFQSDGFFGGRFKQNTHFPVLEESFRFHPNRFSGGCLKRNHTFRFCNPLVLYNIKRNNLKNGKSRPVGSRAVNYQHCTGPLGLTGKMDAIPTFYSRRLAA